MRERLSSVPTWCWCTLLRLLLHPRQSLRVTPGTKAWQILIATLYDAGQPKYNKRYYFGNTENVLDYISLIGVEGAAWVHHVLDGVRATTDISCQERT